MTDRPTIDARPARLRREPAVAVRDVGWRAVLVLAAAAAALLNTSPWLRTPLVLIAVAAVAERVGRQRRRGLLDGALVAVATVVVAVGLLGLALNFLPGGITRVSWSIGGAVLGVGTLGALTLAPGTPPPSLVRRPSGGIAWPLLGWVGAAIVVLVGAVGLATRSYDQTHVAPLAIAATDVRSGSATLTITSGSPAGPFELDLVTTSGRSVLAPAIVLDGTNTVVVKVTVPAGVRALVQLVSPGDTEAVRELILDSTPPTSALVSGATG